MCCSPVPYQDAMAIARHERRTPDLFLAKTCNPDWDQTTTDRPDLVSRVFQMKLQAFVEARASACAHHRLAGDPLAPRGL